MSELLSSVEIVMADRSPVNTHPIPPITDPLGKSWKQPDRNRIEIDENHALISRSDFESLPTYSTTVPSGVYPGKMWKRQKCIRQNGTDFIQWLDEWWLCWFGHSDAGENFCSNNYRTLLIV